MLHCGGISSSGLTTALQQMQDHPEWLAKSRRRFDAETPPIYSSGHTTRVPTPVWQPPLTEEEKGEIIRQPLDIKERTLFAQLFHPYRPRHRYNTERKMERTRIENDFTKRDSQDQWTYRGPDLIGRAGRQREEIMVRNSIKKRWQALGVWNPAWGIPGRAIIEDKDTPDYWSWKWSLVDRVPHDSEDTLGDANGWPIAARESPDHRAIRLHLKDKGEWEDPIDDVGTDGGEFPEEQVTGRPWYQWELEVLEEAIRRLRVQRQYNFPLCEEAEPIVKERWKAKGVWNDRWDDKERSGIPGWRWRWESPSPEPEDSSNMDFTRSEIDAFEIIPPPTPPKVWVGPDTSHTEARYCTTGLFANLPLFSSKPDAGVTKRPDKGGPGLHDDFSKAEETRSSRKRKRIQDYTGIREIPRHTVKPKDHRPKRARTAASKADLSQRSMKALAAHHAPNRVRKGNAIEDPNMKPRRSPRIAALRRPYEDTTHDAKSTGTIRRSRDKVAPRTRQQVEKLRPKQPESTVKPKHRAQTRTKAEPQRKPTRRSRRLYPSILKS